MPLLDPETADALGLLQALDDAITHRSARLAAPCPDCQPGRRCDDHATDQNLIAGYQRRHAGALSAVLARPAETSAAVMPPAAPGGVVGGVDWSRWSVVLLKPDCLRRGLADDVLAPC